jgi:hypothetical protein
MLYLNFQNLKGQLNETLIKLDQNKSLIIFDYYLHS